MRSLDSHIPRPRASIPSSTQSLPPAAVFTIFDNRQKALIVLLVSTAATFSGFASNIYFPVLPTIAQDLDVSTELVSLSITAYLIFQGLAPSLWGPVSDTYGRRPAYWCTLAIFLAACIGLANSTNYATLIALRCLQSAGSASTIAIGSGVIGDITTRETRGGYMGIFQAGLLAPVAIGPIIGGALAESLGWRSIFWFLSICCGVVLVLLTLLLPETLRNMVGNGSLTPSIAVARYPLLFYQEKTSIRWERRDSSSVSITKKASVDLLGPLRILISKQAGPIVFFIAVYYAVWQMSLTAMATLFKDYYGLSDSEIGLTFIANGVGSIIGTLATGQILNWTYSRIKSSFDKSRSEASAAVEGQQEQEQQQEADSDFPLESARLRLIPIFAMLQCASIAVFGWTIQYHSHVHIAVPITCTFVTGWTAIGTQSLVMTYLVDVFPTQSGAASASLNLARCLLAAAGTSFVMPLVNGVGVGWAFTVCMGLQLAGSVGAGIQWQFGPRWRREALESHKQ